MEGNLHNYEVEPQHTMKWHKFLIYFSLWASAILCFGDGIVGLVRLQRVSPEAFSQLTWLFVLLAAVCIVQIGIGALYIVTRFKLAAYKASGPKLFIGLCIAPIVLGLIALVMGMIVEGIDGEIVGDLIGDVVYLVLNCIYYKKRAYLFVN